MRYNVPGGANAQRVDSESWEKGAVKARLAAALGFLQAERSMEAAGKPGIGGSSYRNSFIYTFREEFEIGSCYPYRLIRVFNIQAGYYIFSYLENSQICALCSLTKH